MKPNKNIQLNDDFPLYGPFAEWKNEIREEGRKEGRKKGREEGLEEGHKEAIEENRIENQERVKLMLNDGLPLEKILKYTGLSEETLVNLQNKCSRKN